MVDLVVEGEVRNTRTLAERAYGLIRADILSGQFAAGEKLRIDRLKDAYEIGASPLREALARLSSEGLVVLEGQRGFRVAKTSIEELWDITEARVLLETEAVYKALQIGDDLWEAGVVASFHRLKRVDARIDPGAPRSVFAEWEARNRDFHDALVQGCRSPWLLRLRAQLYDQHERYRRASVMQGDRRRDVHEEHRRILQAVLDRDIGTACRATAEHILATAVTLSRAIAPPGASAEEWAARILEDLPRQG